MEREGSNHIIPDLEKLSLEKGRNIEVEDLDDDGWRAASEQKKIVEIGSLGEGAGGAVTRCKLVGGKTEFALKVKSPPKLGKVVAYESADNHHRSQSRRQEADSTRASLQQRLLFGTYLSILRSVHGRLQRYYLNRYGVLRRRKPRWRLP